MKESDYSKIFFHFSRKLLDQTFKFIYILKLYFRVFQIINVCFLSFLFNTMCMLAEKFSFLLFLRQVFYYSCTIYISNKIKLSYRSKYRRNSSLNITYKNSSTNTAISLRTDQEDPNRIEFAITPKSYILIIHS